MASLAVIVITTQYHVCLGVGCIQLLTPNHDVYKYSLVAQRHQYHLQSLNTIPHQQRQSSGGNILTMFTSHLTTALAVGIGALVAQVNCHDDGFAPDLTWISENSNLPKVVYVYL